MTSHEAARALLATLPGPPLGATVTASETGIEIVLDGDEPVILRAMALALLADEVGDADGPEKYPYGRCVVGTYAGFSVLVQVPITAAEQSDLNQLAAGLLDQIGLI